MRAPIGEAHFTPAVAHRRPAVRAGQGPGQIPTASRETESQRVSLSATDVSHRLNQHLPPHLREVCIVLARGLVRLRSHDVADDMRDLGGTGESSLHFQPEPSVCGRHQHEDAA